MSIFLYIYPFSDLKLYSWWINFTLESVFDYFELWVVYHGWPWDRAEEFAEKIKLAICLGRFWGQKLQNKKKIKISFKKW